MHTGMRVSRLTTGTCAKSTKLRCGSPMLVFMPRRPEHHIAVAFGSQVFRRIQRLVQRDAEAALEQDRHLGLPPDDFQQLEVLRVARADLQHHAGRVAGLVQRFLDLVEVRFMGDLHRDHLDAVFARQLEHIGQAIFAVPLERIRDWCAVCTRPCACTPGRCRAMP